MARELVVKIVGDPSDLERAFGRAAASTESFGQRLEKIGHGFTKVGKRLTLGVTTPLVAAGVASFKMASDFDTSMSRIVGLAGQSQKQVDAWGQELLKLGPKLGKGPRELGEALYFVASSGVPAGKAMSVVNAAAKASVAGLGDTAQVADAVTSAMNAYGASNITAARATDVLIATVREGKGEASEFAPVIGNVTAFAAKMGVSFEDVGAALASMTQLGTDAATSSTQLSAFFSQLVKETPKGAKALENVGLSYAGIRKELREKGLLATIQTLTDAFDGNVQAMSGLFGNVRALRAVFGLVDESGSRVEGVFKRMEDSSGSLAKAFEESTKRTGFTMEKFRASVEAAGIAIGTILAPIVEKVATFLTKMSIAFQNLDPTVQQIIIGVAAFAAVMGPVLIIIGSLISAIGVLIPVFAALATPIGLVVVAVAALVAAIVAAVVWPDKLKAALVKMGLSAKDAETVVKSLQHAFEAIKVVVQAVWPAIQGIIVNALTVIKGIFNVVMGLLQGDWARVWKGMKQIVDGALKGIVALLTALPGTVLRLAAQIAEAILRGLADGLKRLGPVVREGFKALPGVLAGIAAQVPGWAAQIGQQIVEGIISGMGGLAGRISSYIGDKLSSALSHIDIPGWSPPEHAAAEAIGKPLADGAAKGVRDSDMDKKVAEALANKLRQAISNLQTRRGEFESQFASLADAATSAFDARWAQWKPASQIKLDKMQLADQIKSEKAAIVNAQRDLDAARAQAAQEASTENLQRVIQAEQALADARRSQKEAELGREAQLEQEAHDKKIARQRVHLQQELDEVQAFLDKHPEKYKQAQEKINLILKQNGVDAKFWGTAVGIALAAGIRATEKEVRASAVALARAIQKVLKLRSPAEEGPLSDLDQWWAPFARTLLSGFDTGAIEDAGRTVAASFSTAFKQFGTSDAADAPVETLTTTGEAFTATEETVTSLSTALQALPTTASQALTALMTITVNTLQKMPKVLAPIIQAFLDVAAAIHQIGFDAYYARNALRDTADEIAKLIAKITQAGGPIPGRAVGGPVYKGQAYVVGEKGPELFIPNASGRIMPNSTATAGSAWMAGGGGVVVQVYGDVTGEEIVDKVREGLLRINLYNPGSAIARA